MWYIFLMNEQIQNVLKSHYGVTECVVNDRFDNDTIEVYCVGGNVDYIKIALAQLCEVEDSDVTIEGGSGDRQLFVVSVN